MSHSYCNCLVHYVFSTKDRRNLIPGNLTERLYPYVGGIARENGMKALAVGGTENHMHILASLPPTLSVAKSVQLLKGGSSKWVHETFPVHAGFAWQEGYGGFSIGVSGIDNTLTYIQNQREHHRHVTFEEEFIAFLNRHGIEHDERYVWG